MGIIQELKEVGEKLLLIGSYSVDELCKLLEKTGNLLSNMDQYSLDSTPESLHSVMQALIKDELLLHTERNIQIAMACCMNELSRITAPQAPYSDTIMKEIYRLFMVALNQLSSESASDHTVPLKILATFVKVKTCLNMMDIDYKLIVEMFQLLFNSIRSDHSSDSVDDMKTIMTMVIKESDGTEISSHLLEPLLTSVKLDNKKISPVSWVLGENVIQQCASKLQPYLREAVKSKNLDLDDYPEIVISLCQDLSNGKNKSGRLKDNKSIKTQQKELKRSSTVRNKNQETKKVDSHSNSKPTKTKILKNLDQEKKQEQKPRSPLNDAPKEEIVDSVIQVWWPLDKKFYQGTVTAFNPKTNKHTIKYDDGDTEMLNLKKENWTLLNDKKPQRKRTSRKGEEADEPSRATEPVKKLEKKMKRKTSSSNKQLTTSSSKRSKVKHG